MAKWIFLLAAARPLGVFGLKDGPNNLDRCQDCQYPKFPVPGATVKSWTRSTWGQVDHLQCAATAEVVCLPGYSVDGTPGGDTNFTLTCKTRWEDSEVEGKGCAPIGGDETHCQDAKCIRGRGCQLDSAWKQESLVPEGGCSETKGGASCRIWCAPGYHQATPDRYTGALDVNDQVPVTLVCNNGTFQKKGSAEPPTCVKAEDKLLEFDVYALLWQNESGALFHPSGAPVGPSGLPSNINVFDLEGLLSHLYTEVHTGQQVLANIPTLYRERESGKFVMRHSNGQKEEYKPTLPYYRDNVNTVVWYRMQVKQPAFFGDPGDLTKFEYGTFANFIGGKAMNDDAIAEYKQFGSVVGLGPQEDGLVGAYEVTQEGKDAGTEQETCGNRRKRSRLQPSYCKKVFHMRSDPRYAASGRFNAFSLPGVCPDQTFEDKGNDNGVNCLELDNSASAIQGGLCSSPPDGSPNCTYSLQEITRVPLDSMTRVGDLRKFQLTCTDESLRKGVKIDGTDQRECVEYAAQGEDSCRICYQDCGVAKDHKNDSVAFVVGGENVTCAVPGESCEVSIPFFRDRCNPDSNLERLQALRKAFLQAAKDKQPKPVEIVQDCSKHKNCRPSTMNKKLGLNYCERDSAGLCSSCYIPGTRKFKQDRATTAPCREDLFTSGGYKGTSGSWRPSCKDGKDGVSCWKYLLLARNADPSLNWQFNDSWSNCSVTCGQGYRHREAFCPSVDAFGACRRELGDPSSGYCDDTGCHSTENCDGVSCTWVPECREGEAPVNCIEQKWTTLHGSCVEGTRFRLRRCDFYAPGGNSSKYCPDSSAPKTSKTELLGVKSRLHACTSCDIDGGCGGCAGSGLFELEDGKCVNTGPFFQFKLSISMPAKHSEAFKSRSFSALDALVTGFAASSKAWDNSGTKAFLMDLYTYIPPTTTATTTTVATTTVTSPSTSTNTALRTTTTTTASSEPGNATATTSSGSATTTTITTTTTNSSIPTGNSSNSTNGSDWKPPEKLTSITTTTATFTTTTANDKPAPSNSSNNTPSSSNHTPRDNSTDESNDSTPALRALASPVILKGTHQKGAGLMALGPDEDKQEHWELVIVVSLDTAIAGREMSDLEEMATKGAADIASGLAQELKEQVSVSHDKGFDFYCPGFEGWGNCGGGPGLWVWLLRIGLGLAAVALLVGGAVLLVRLRKNGRLCTGQQQGLEMQARSSA